MKRILTLVGMFLLFVSLSAWAQDTATIVGSVTDATGAVIPNAKVTVANSDKGFTRELVSNAAGEYTAAKIPIGDYVITCAVAGFQKLVRTGITVAVGQTLRVDLQMTVGQVTQEVTVTGNVVRVETETAAISDVVTGTQIANFMINGRNWVTLALLVPGAVPDNGLNTRSVGVYGNNNISFNGGRTTYNNWEVDGGPNTDEGSASTFNTYPSLDTIAEFRISTSNYGADMGKHAGATIEVATKSGTKDFHGTVFEYVRNDKFDANDWFINRQINPEGGKAPKRSLKWNDYGYNIGGPFYIPGAYNTDKTKTFFFWSQNWRKYREGSTIGPVNVPSMRMRDGDFSECHKPGLLGPEDPGSPNYNPAIVDAGCTLPDLGEGLVDSVPVDPNGKALLDAFVPLPNSGVIGYIKSPGLPTDWRQEQIRVDHNISDKARIFVRYTQDAWGQTVVPSLWNWSAYDTVKTKFDGPGKSAVMNLTYSFKPNLMNEFVMGYTVDHILLYPQVGASSVAGSIDKPSTWTVSNLFSANSGNPLLPGVAICGGLPFCIYQSAANHPWFNSNPIITWKDNMAWTAGRHTLKFGFFLEKFRKNEQFGNQTQGDIYFDDWGSNTTGNGLADMFLGRIQQYNEGTRSVNGRLVGGYAKGYWRMTAFEPYIQDDWKVTPKLTLNIGARYYLFTRIHDVSRPTIDSAFVPSLYDPRYEKLLLSDGNIDNSDASLALGYTHDFTTHGNGLVECGSGPILKGCQTPYYWTLAPRFGFAYDPWGNGKTVFRGGYGIYYEMGNGNEAQTEGIQGNPPSVLAPNLFNLDGYDAIQPITSFEEAAAYGPPGIQTIPYRQKWGSVQQFSFGIQHEFPGNNVFSLGYVGAMGRHLGRNRNLNQIPIGVGTLSAPWLGGADPVEGCDAAGNCDVQNILINQRVPAIHFRPYRGYDGIGVKENTAVSSYHSLQVNFRHVFGHGLTFQTSYTWSKALDDSTSPYSGNSEDVDTYNLSRWKAISGNNRTQVLVLNYVYDLPMFKNSTNPVLKNVFGGWTISGITSLFTGQPIDFNCGVSGYGTGIGTSVRCNTVGEFKIKKGVIDDPEYGPTPTWFDPTVVAQPTQDQLWAYNQAGMFGYMGRNPLTGPGRNNWDMALLKNISLPWVGPENSTLQFRFETFNTWNHPQWRGIDAGCSSSIGFGQPCTQRGNSQVNSAWEPRIIQLGLKFIF